MHCILILVGEDTYVQFSWWSASLLSFSNLSIKIFVLLIEAWNLRPATCVWPECTSSVWYQMLISPVSCGCLWAPLWDPSRELLWKKMVGPPDLEWTRLDSASGRLRAPFHVDRSRVVGSGDRSTGVGFCLSMHADFMPWAGTDFPLESWRMHLFSCGFIHVFQVELRPEGCM